MNTPQLWCNGECIGEWRPAWGTLPNAGDVISDTGIEYHVCHREFDKTNLVTKIHLIKRGIYASPTVTVIKAEELEPKQKELT